MVTATAGSPRHHALKYRTALATPLATFVAAAVATNSDTAYHVVEPVNKSTAILKDRYMELGCHC